MIILTEEQKLLLKCYQGGRYKVIQQLEEGIEILEGEPDAVEMVENMKQLVRFLQNCSNRTFFEMKRATVLDIEIEGEGSGI